MQNKIFPLPHKKKCYYPKLDISHFRENNKHKNTTKDKPW